MTTRPSLEVLNHHGDADVDESMLDFAVNIYGPLPPPWLVEKVLTGYAAWNRYPNSRRAQEALAAKFGVDPAMVVPTSGAAEASTLIARAIPASHPVMVHPQFTEPEAAMLRAGREVDHVYLPADDDFYWVPGIIPDDADLVFIGNPTNPTGALHAATDLRDLVRPGRLVVVDEAFMDFLHDGQSMIAPEMEGVLVVRSLTKILGVPGLRAGFVVTAPEVAEQLRAHQPPWSVSQPAIDVMEASTTEAFRTHRENVIATTAFHRADLMTVLESLGLQVIVSDAPFVLVNTTPILGKASVREPLARRGIAVRRGESFPGLGPEWIRLAVRTPADHARLADALVDIARTEGARASRDEEPA